MKRINDKTVIAKGYMNVVERPELLGHHWNELIDTVTRLQDKVDRHEEEIRSLRRQLSNVRAGLF